MVMVWEEWAEVMEWVVEWEWVVECPVVIDTINFVLGHTPTCSHNRRKKFCQGSVHLYAQDRRCAS